MSFLCWTQIWPEEEGTWQLFASSPEAMAEADAVIENLLKVWMKPCSLLSRVQKSWPRLTLSLRTF
jgi:hypothetical protein